VEAYAYILDYLPNGRSTEHGFHREATALAVGVGELKLLEIVPKLSTPLTPGSRIPLLPENAVPPPIDHVRRRVGYDELTAAARTELPIALEKIVVGEAPRFLRFFNESESISPRFHLLELLPGIGKKTMLALVEERRKGPYASFEDIERRAHLHHPERLLVERIVQELSGAPDKYRLFVAP
jgi:putative nucleotide binding protein